MPPLRAGALFPALGLKKRRKGAPISPHCLSNLGQRKPLIVSGARAPDVLEWRRWQWFDQGSGSLLLSLSARLSARCA